MFYKCLTRSLRGISEVAVGKTVVMKYILWNSLLFHQLRNSLYKPEKKLLVVYQEMDDGFLEMG